jgi:hypothetical protein
VVEGDERLDEDREDVEGEDVEGEDVEGEDVVIEGDLEGDAGEAAAFDDDTKVLEMGPIATREIDITETNTMDNTKDLLFIFIKSFSFLIFLF